jgi:hypothetical protein
MEPVMTSGWTKSCLTCGKIMPAGASYCPRCGGAFLRASEALFRRPARPLADPMPLPANRSVPPLLAHSVGWYAGRLVRRLWLFILAIW